MKKMMTVVLFGGLMWVLAGCEPSAQEKLAKIQLEQQKAMVEGFQKAATEAQKAAAEASKEKPVYKKWNLYPPK